MRLRKIFIKFSIFIVGIAVMDLTLSQVAKRVAPQWRNGVLEKEARILVSPYHHGFKPYADFIHKYGDLQSPLYTNSLGFRDASPREVSLKRKGRRLLIIGDSITEGVGIPYEKTFAGLIDKTLQKDRIETLNAGVQSYAHQIYYTKVVHFLDKRNLEVSDVAVFVDIGDVANDVTQYKTDENGNVVRVNINCRYGIGCRYRAMKRFKVWLKDNSILYRSYKVLKAWRREKSSRLKADPLAAATNIPGARWTFLDEEYQEYGIKGLQVAEKVMTKLSDFLAKRKIGLTVVVYPWPDQIVKRDLDSRQVLFWRGWAERNNAGFLNLFPAFIDQRPAEEVYRKYFIPYDNHFNEQGHEMVAARFLAQFKR